MNKNQLSLVQYYDSNKWKWAWRTTGLLMLVANCYNKITLVYKLEKPSTPSILFPLTRRSYNVSNSHTYSSFPSFSPLPSRTSWVPIAMLTTENEFGSASFWNSSAIVFGCQREFATVFCFRILQTKRILLRLLHEERLWVSVIWGYVLFRFDVGVGGPPSIYVTRCTHVRLSLNWFAWSVWRVLQLFLGTDAGGGQFGMWCFLGL